MTTPALDKCHCCICNVAIPCDEIETVYIANAAEQTIGLGLHCCRCSKTGMNINVVNHSALMDGNIQSAMKGEFTEPVAIQCQACRSHYADSEIIKCVNCGKLICTNCRRTDKCFVCDDGFVSGKLYLFENPSPF